MQCPYIRRRHDIPECDSIYLTHPNNNIISIIQRISRANRLDKNNINKIAKIFVWSKNEIKLESITKNISKFMFNSLKVVSYVYKEKKSSINV